MRLIGKTKEDCEKKAIDYLKSTLYAENGGWGDKEIYCLNTAN